MVSQSILYEEHVVTMIYMKLLRLILQMQEWKKLVFTDLKQVRDERISEITAEIFDLLFEKFGNDDEEQFPRLILMKLF